MNEEEKQLLKIIELKDTEINELKQTIEDLREENAQLRGNCWTYRFKITELEEKLYKEE